MSSNLLLYYLIARDMDRNPPDLSNSIFASKGMLWFVGALLVLAFPYVTIPCLILFGMWWCTRAACRGIGRMARQLWAECVALITERKVLPERREPTIGNLTVETLETNDRPIITSAPEPPLPIVPEEGRRYLVAPIWSEDVVATFRGGEFHLDKGNPLPPQCLDVLEVLPD
jgi:hypothetical protein